MLNASFLLIGCQITRACEQGWDDALSDMMNRDEVGGQAQEKTMNWFIRSSLPRELRPIILLIRIPCENEPVVIIIDEFSLILLTV